MDRDDIRADDHLIIRVPVVTTPSKGLAVQLGDAVVTMPNLVVKGHDPRIKAKDWIRERGSNVLGGDRFGRVITFYDDAGAEHPAGAVHALCMMDRRSDLEPGNAGPRVYRMADIERVPLKDWPKGGR